MAAQLKISVCIPTHERAALLARTLDALGRQNRLPDEIVVSDSSLSDAGREAAAQFAAGFGGGVHYVRTSRRALPWQRWFAFTHCSGDVALFMDDDVRLAPEAIARLMAAFEGPDGENVAGVGLRMTLEPGGVMPRNRHSFRERWLGMSTRPAGTLTPGGLTISAAGLEAGHGAPVQWLCGGAMAYRRRVIESIGPLEGLYDLYDLGIGKGEDGVLSSHAGRLGRLLLLTQDLAFHPAIEEAVSTANVHSGWRRGLRETFGRAHTLRWTAPDPEAVRGDWLRLATLEWMRAGAGILRSPLAQDSYTRLAGGLYGVALSALRWRRVPPAPDSPLPWKSVAGLPPLAERKA